MRKVAERFRVSKNTVQKLVKQKRETGNINPQKSKGRKTQPTNRVGKRSDEDGRRT